MARRLAEVACPPGMREGGRTEEVLAEFGLMLGALAPAARRALRAGMLALDEGARLYPPARGRRFTRLDDGTAEAYLQAVLNRSGGAGQLVQRLRGLVVMCYYELPEVQREIGYQPGPFIAAVSRRRLESYGPAIAAGEAAVAPAWPAGRAGRLVTGADVSADVHVECDVVIVGSGAGGATTAAELAEAGLDVVVIEEGGYHPTGSFSADTMRALRTLYRDGGGGMAVGQPSVVFAEGRCVGGSTVVNGGMSWPAPGRVLDRWSAAGVRGISEADMAPYFARAEARHSAGPQDPETIGRDSELMRAGPRSAGPWRPTGGPSCIVPGRTTATAAARPARSAPCW
jgi:hypothetical protein